MKYFTDFTRLLFWEFLDRDLAAVDGHIGARLRSQVSDGSVPTSCGQYGCHVPAGCRRRSAV